METNSTTRSSKGRVLAGRILSTLIVLFLLFNGVLSILKPPVVVQGVAHLGYPDIARAIGILLLGCAILYAIPRTAVFGAIMMTAYLGGATASHIRIGEPFWVPVVVGVLIWMALYLREERLHALVPVRR